MISDRMKAIKVPLRDLNNTRLKLMEKKLMRMDYKIKTDDKFGYIPIYENDNLNYEIVNVELNEIKVFPKNFTELLDGKLSSEECEILKTSFDTIGDIVILEIPKNLEHKKKIIGKATLEFTKRKSIYMKKSAVKGQTRIRELELIAGENNPITIHKEHQTRLKLNVCEVYFSPRLATERKRIMENVKNSEKILDMFCGIGPFPIVIAKNKNCEITACDINDKAIKYLNENIKLNKLKGTIKPICNDISKVNFKNKFDRILMNLPGSAYEFLNIAIKNIKDKGIIHYYEFSDDYEQGIKRIKKECIKENKNVEITNTRKVKSISPGIWHIAIDAKINQK